ncbi:hypothetical protein GCM10009716_31970 [Streptomyces sodiiphilus]|uniref:Uncharacterized protein n=1 Tax=Streptomyces sodiiphilus TaxID=226217 RepID=A0ABN2PI34_9ACTN
MGVNETRAPRPPGGGAGVEVHIGELVLDGFPRADAGAVAGAFRAELTRLVREHGVPLAEGGDRELDLLSGLPPLPRATSSRGLGRALARSVHAGLTRPPEHGRGAGPADGRGRGR